MLKSVCQEIFDCYFFFMIRTPLVPLGKQVKLFSNILATSKTEVENVLSGAQMGLNHEKMRGRISRDTLPLSPPKSY